MRMLVQPESCVYHDLGACIRKRLWLRHGGCNPSKKCIVCGQSALDINIGCVAGGWLRQMDYT